MLKSIRRLFFCLFISIVMPMSGPSLQAAAEDIGSGGLTGFAGQLLNPENYNLSQVGAMQTRIREVLDDLVARSGIDTEKMERGARHLVDRVESLKGPLKTIAFHAVRNRTALLIAGICLWPGKWILLVAARSPDAPKWLTWLASFIVPQPVSNGINRAVSHRLFPSKMIKLISILSALSLGFLEMPTPWRQWAVTQGRDFLAQNFRFWAPVAGVGGAFVLYKALRYLTTGEVEGEDDGLGGGFLSNYLGLPTAQIRGLTDNVNGILGRVNGLLGTFPIDDFNAWVQGGDAANLQTSTRWAHGIRTTFAAGNLPDALMPALLPLFREYLEQQAAIAREIRQEEWDRRSAGELPPVEPSIADQLARRLGTQEGFAAACDTVTNIVGPGTGGIIAQASAPSMIEGYFQGVRFEEDRLATLRAAEAERKDRLLQTLVAQKRDANDIIAIMQGVYGDPNDAGSPVVDRLAEVLGTPEGFNIACGAIVQILGPEAGGHLIRDLGPAAMSHYFSQSTLAQEQECGLRREEAARRNAFIETLLGHQIGPNDIEQLVHAVYGDPNAGTLDPQQFIFSLIDKMDQRREVFGDVLRAIESIMQEAIGQIFATEDGHSDGEPQSFAEFTFIEMLKAQVAAAEGVTTTTTTTADAIEQPGFGATVAEAVGQLIREPDRWFPQLTALLLTDGVPARINELMLGVGAMNSVDTFAQAIVADDRRLHEGEGADDVLPLGTALDDDEGADAGHATFGMVLERAVWSERSWRERAGLLGGLLKNVIIRPRQTYRESQVALQAWREYQAAGERGRDIGRFAATHAYDAYDTQRHQADIFPRGGRRGARSRGRRPGHRRTRSSGDLRGSSGAQRE